MKEFEKIASTLVPDKDWSMRIAAMQRIEGLVIGGLLTTPCTIKSLCFHFQIVYFKCFGVLFYVFFLLCGVITNCISSLRCVPIQMVIKAKREQRMHLV